MLFFNSNPGVTDLGVLPGGLHSYAYGINDSGQVVGNCSYTGFQHAFMWNGSMHDLGGLDPENIVSEAYAINNNGQVVGKSKIPGGSTHAFLYSGGVMLDLNSLVNLPGVNLYTAYGINDRGQILANSSFDGYLLTPVSSLAAIDLLLLD
jgi:probable HAF family extracellular repeat protein